MCDQVAYISEEREKAAVERERRLQAIKDKRIEEKKNVPAKNQNKPQRTKKRSRECDSRMKPFFELQATFVSKNTAAPKASSLLPLLLNMK